MIVAFIVGAIFVYAVTVYVRGLAKVRAKYQSAFKVNGVTGVDRNAPQLIVKE